MEVIISSPKYIVSLPLQDFNFAFSDVLACQAEKTEEYIPLDLNLTSLTAQGKTSLGRVLVICCKGQIIDYLGDKETPQMTTSSCFKSKVNFQERWKVNFFKCIDASPLLVQFERYSLKYFLIFY